MREAVETFLISSGISLHKTHMTNKKQLFKLNKLNEIDGLFSNIIAENEA